MLPPSAHRSFAKKSRSGPTHQEVMEKRHAKRKKNGKKNRKIKKMNLLKEYQSLSKAEYVSKKTTAMNLMELIEDIKEKIPDGSYLKMMDELMALNKESENTQNLSQTDDDDSDDNTMLNYFMEYYFYDRIGHRNNINHMNNININHNENNINIIHSDDR